MSRSKYKWITHGRDRWLWLGEDRKILQPPFYQGETIVGWRRENNAFAMRKAEEMFAFNSFDSSEWPNRYQTWLVRADDGKLKETYHTGEGVICGHVDWFFIEDCSCKGNRRCGVRKDHGYCMRKERVEYLSSPWARCLFCGKGGKVASRRNGGTISPHPYNLGCHAWGSRPKQVREEESLLSGDYENNKDHICHACDRRLAHLYDLYMNCNDLIKQLEQPRNAEAANQERAATITADVDQDDAGLADTAYPNASGFIREADYH